MCPHIFSLAVVWTLPSQNFDSFTFQPLCCRFAGVLSDHDDAACPVFCEAFTSASTLLWYTEELNFKLVIAGCPGGVPRVVAKKKHQKNNNNNQIISPPPLGLTAGTEVFLMKRQKKPTMVWILFLRWQSGQDLIIVLPKATWFSKNHEKHTDEPHHKTE